MQRALVQTFLPRFQVSLETMPDTTVDELIAKAAETLHYITSGETGGATDGQRD